MSDYAPQVLYCTGCHYSHPPPTGDDCRILKKRRALESKKGTVIFELIEDIEKYLNEFEDPKPIVVKIRKFLRSL